MSARLGLASRGDIIVSVIIFASITILITSALVNWGAAMLRGIRIVAEKEQAFQIAEAGVDYYQWHLAQNPTDYKDGTTTPGPYIHQFYDRNGNLLGNYSLTITPPITGSTIVTINSVGTLASTSISRTVQEKLAIPSLARFAVIANDNMNFGAGTTVFGPIQSNFGVHFDGLAENLVSSALSTYTDPDTGQNEFGVYTDNPCTGYPSGDPQPPAAVPSCPGTFAAGRQFPVPAFDFAGLTVGLTQLQTLAQTGGKEWTASNSQGYHIVFEVNAGITSYFMYKVTALQPVPSNCGNDPTAQSETQWGTWTIKNLVGSNQAGASETMVNGTNADHSWPIPGNGVIFVDDNVWVDGQINNARVTVAAGIIGSSNPNNYSNITINTNLLYTNFTGTDVIGLIAQGNINAGMVSDDTYNIDAALVAENGRVGRFYYNSSCSVSGTNYSARSSLTLLGMIATDVRYGFAFSDNTGYATRNINFDANLLYGPPPSFPQATNQYQVISWQQIN